MTPRRVLTLLLSGVTLALSGGYMFVYLYRWEWNRAVISGIIFLAAEVAVLGWALNGKLNEVARGTNAARAQRISAHLSASRTRRDRFEWLSDPSRTGVFIPILLGTGLLLSLLASIVEWIARRTTERGFDDRLARSLARLSPPPGGFLDDSGDPLRSIRGPMSRRH